MSNYYTKFGEINFSNIGTSTVITGEGVDKDNKKYKFFKMPFNYKYTYVLDKAGDYIKDSQGNYFKVDKSDKSKFVLPDGNLLDIPATVKDRYKAVNCVADFLFELPPISTNGYGLNINPKTFIEKDGTKKEYFEYRMLLELDPNNPNDIVLLNDFDKLQVRIGELLKQKGGEFKIQASTFNPSDPKHMLPIFKFRMDDNQEPITSGPKSMSVKAAANTRYTIIEICKDGDGNVIMGPDGKPKFNQRYLKKEEFTMLKGNRLTLIPIIKLETAFNNTSSAVSMQFKLISAIILDIKEYTNIEQNIDNSIIDENISRISELEEKIRLMKAELESRKASESVTSSSPSSSVGQVVSNESVQDMLLNRLTQQQQLPNMQNNQMMNTGMPNYQQSQQPPQGQSQQVQQSQQFQVPQMPQPLGQQMQQGQFQQFPNMNMGTAPSLNMSSITSMPPAMGTTSNTMFSSSMLPNLNQ